MRSIVILLILGLLGPALGAQEVSLADLATERQEHLYYEADQLPATVQALIEQPLGVAAMIEHYRRVGGEKDKFNLILIMGGKTELGLIAGGDRELAVGFFETCLADPNPWVRTEAVYAIGNAQGDSALATVRRHLEDPSDLVTFHAILSLLQIQGDLPALDERQAEVLRRVGSGLEAGRGNELADAELDAYLRHGVW
jgi:hypothetical protein